MTLLVQNVESHEVFGDVGQVKCFRHFWIESTGMQLGFHYLFLEETCDRRVSDWRNHNK